MKFNEKLIELRRKQGLSQEELGYKLNVTRQTISKWELGQTTPEMDKLSEMSKIFNISLDQLINESEVENNSNVGPINSKIEDQPIQEKENNKTKTILLIVLTVVIVIIMAKVILGMLGLSLFNKAANQVLDMGAGMFNSTMNKDNSVGGEIFDMATGIINSTINDMQNNSNKEDMANSIAEGFNMISGIIGDNTGANLSDQISQTQNEVSVKSFNGPIELYAGTSKKLFATTVLDKIITSNKTNDRKITVKYDKTETQDESKIRTIKQTINKANAFQDFEIICEYDAKGYIYKVIIEKV